MTNGPRIRDARNIHRPEMLIKLGGRSLLARCRPHPSKGGSGSDVGIGHVGARGCEVLHPVAMMQPREPRFCADGLQSGLRGHASVVELGGDYQRYGQQSVPHVYRFGEPLRNVMGSSGS